MVPSEGEMLADQQIPGSLHPAGRPDLNFLPLHVSWGFRV